MDGGHHFEEEAEDHSPYCVRFSEITTHDLHFILTVLILGPISLLGIVMNFLCIIILSQDSRKSTAAFLLLLMAVADGFFMLFDFASMTAPALASMGPMCTSISAESKATYKQTLPYLLTLMEVARTLSVWLTAVALLSRYVDVFNPLHSSPHCTLPCIKKQIIALAIYCAIFNIPRFFELRRHCHSHEESHQSENHTITEPPVEHKQTTGDKCLYNTKFAIPYNVLIVALNHFIPVLIVGSLTYKLGALWKLHTSDKLMKSEQQFYGGYDQHMHVTRTIVAIGTLFLFCEVPFVGFMFHQIFRRIYPEMEPNWDSRAKSAVATIISYLFQDLNCCSKFIIYFIFGKKFRKHVQYVFKCCALKPLTVHRRRSLTRETIVR
ncbi:FMRFamide receptor-like [Tubulanus polymorphus]|uniref:FMRFamide receptor-like n=1 Tax=Tubulanus polymorphus TaxID=672921 RepID=UPI003DA3B4E7